jgi:tetratricopeptide (TPR) repeat protein
MINNSDDSFLNLQKAKDNYLSKDYQKSLLYIIKHLKLYPNNFEGLLLKSKIYSCLENFKKSIQSFEKCLRLNSKSIEAIYGQAKCFKELEFYNEAISKYKKILEFEPKAKIYNSISACLYCMGNKEEAICQYCNSNKSKLYSCLL